MSKIRRDYYYVDHEGKRCRKGAPGAMRRESPRWYGDITYADGTRRPKALSADAATARQMLRALQSEQDLLRHGLSVQKAPTAHGLDGLLDQWEADLQAQGDHPRHYRQHVQRVRSVADALHWQTTADLNGDELTRELYRRRQAKEIGTTTSNHYLRACKSFARWLLMRDILERNPFKSKPLSADPQRHRRSLCPEDFDKLIETTRKSKRAFRRLSGSDRAILYEAAAATGLRAKELAGLEGKQLVGDTLHLPPGQTKNRKAARIPLPAELAKRLRKWAKGKARLWPHSWHFNSAAMLRLDLVEAKIAEKDERGRVFDFHSFRVQFITRLAQAGVSLQTAQKLARHSTPALTANLYTQLEEDEMRAAAEKAWR